MPAQKRGCDVRRGFVADPVEFGSGGRFNHRRTKVLHGANRTKTADGHAAGVGFGGGDRFGHGVIGAVFAHVVQDRVNLYACDPRKILWRKSAF